MTPCVVCHNERGIPRGPGRHSADQFVCRPCQREPMPQLRAHLEVARASGFTFERAWPWALERVRWPHDTDTRREWKRLVGLEPPVSLMEAKDAADMLQRWKAAYERDRPVSREAALVVALA